MRAFSPLSLQKCSYNPDSGHFSPVLNFLGCFSLVAFALGAVLVFREAVLALATTTFLATLGLATAFTAFLALAGFAALDLGAAFLKGFFSGI